MLIGEIPVAVSDRIGIQHAVGAQSVGERGHAGEHLVAGDHTVDENVRDVQALRTELPGQTLRERTQSVFRHGERGERRSRLPRSRRPGEDERAPARRRRGRGRSRAVSGAVASRI